MIYYDKYDQQVHLQICKCIYYKYIGGYAIYNTVNSQICICTCWSYFSPMCCLYILPVWTHYLLKRFFSYIPHNEYHGTSILPTFYSWS